MATFTVTIDMEKACAECGKGGAAESGLCLRCTNRAMLGRPMRSTVGQAVQKRMLGLDNVTGRRAVPRLARGNKRRVVS